MWFGQEGAKMIIRDSYKLVLPEDKAILDTVKTEMTVIKDNQGVPALEVVIDASHGGYVNANYSLYTKEGQQAGAKSFITPFPKPVLVEHDDSKPPIGRVVDSQYVDIPVDQAQLVAAGKKGRPTSKVTVKALITDMDAMQKLMDGRFMTVSISGRPKVAPICSICDKVVDGPFGCEDGHVRGKEYDGKLAYYKIGEMSYSEVSFVNKPADQSDSHAALITSIKAVTAPALVNPGDSQTEKKVEDGKQISDSEVCPECEDKFWTDAEIAELKPISDEYDQEILKDEMGDAKLSAEQRKGLKSSTFCGPNRSFPVPDCAHVTAAKRLIGRAKASESTKSKIMACVNRKAKGMSCSTGDNAESALVLLEAAKNELLEQVKVLTEQKKQAEEALKLATEKIDQTMNSLTKMEDELKKIKEEFTAEQTKVAVAATQVAAAEAQHKQDLEQNTGLIAQLREKIASNIVGMSLLLKKDGLLNVFGGNTVEDRVKSYNASLSKYKDTPLEDLVKLEKQHLDELTKITMVGHNIGPVSGPDSDPMIAEKINAYTSRKKQLSDWWNG
jgi:hypothetical protein